jgi:hypothetical protein
MNPRNSLFECTALRLTGWLLVTDRWGPGWRAEVNGRPAPVFGGNFIFRAIEARRTERHQILVSLIGVAMAADHKLEHAGRSRPVFGLVPNPAP